MKAIISLIFVVILTGCVMPQVKTAPTDTMNLKGSKRIELMVTNSVNTDYSKKALPMFEGLLRGKLKSMGYMLVDLNPQMFLEVNVHTFDPGNRVLRTLIGFGAGRAVLKYTAKFKDPSGILLAELEGGKAYHGVELVDNPTFKSDESTRKGLISYSVSQIGEFIKNNGKLK